MRIGSPSTARGTSVGDVACRAAGRLRLCQRLVGALQRIEQRRAGRRRSDSSVSLPASIFDRSRMSEMMPVRLCALSWICSRYCWRRAGSQILAQRQPRQAEQAVQRRADLVAGVGEEGALGPVRGLGGVARRGQRLLDAAPLGHVLGDPDRAALARVRRIDRLRQDARPEQAAVAAPHLALELDLLAGGEQRPGDAADLGVVRLARPDELRPACRRARPAASRRSRSKCGLACTKRCSRVKAMPIEALSQDRLRARAACARCSVTSRALMTR